MLIVENYFHHTIFVLFVVCNYEFQRECEKVISVPTTFFLHTSLIITSNTSTSPHELASQAYGTLISQLDLLSETHNYSHTIHLCTDTSSSIGTICLNSSNFLGPFIL